MLRSAGTEGSGPSFAPKITPLPGRDVRVVPQMRRRGLGILPDAEPCPSRRRPPGAGCPSARHRRGAPPLHLKVNRREGWAGISGRVASRRFRWMSGTRWPPRGMSSSTPSEPASCRAPTSIPGAVRGASCSVRMTMPGVRRAVALAACPTGPPSSAAPHGRTRIVEFRRHREHRPATRERRVRQRCRAAARSRAQAGQRWATEERQRSARGVKNLSPT